MGQNLTWMKLRMVAPFSRAWAAPRSPIVPGKAANLVIWTLTAPNAIAPRSVPRGCVVAVINEVESSNSTPRTQRSHFFAFEAFIMVSRLTHAERALWNEHLAPTGSAATTANANSTNTPPPPLNNGTPNPIHSTTGLATQLAANNMQNPSFNAGEALANLGMIQKK